MRRPGEPHWLEVIGSIVIIAMLMGFMGACLVLTDDPVYTHYSITLPE